jgi:hypothetical protein
MGPVIEPHNPEMIASVPIEGGADILHTEGYVVRLRSIRSPG